ncbi:DUF2231 domain-containing protein [Streptomyces bohaiensis]|uniref:DUF2231 domain-containing protein n=1 Tax=Streptomyces bohaiensis TaxID=1431344 RepID=A0ABX1C8U0_9ACTN|nr:DUF2231 domain-containing protein [Streptomyces bohaiensis]NJQ15503.1 hypothetical protein [Streptomyces bohaiensis]
MGPTTFNGIPAHPLIVHAVVVLVPLAALMLVLCAAWPSVMRRMGLALPVLSLAALVTVPLATDAGEWLEERVQESAALERHTEMGENLLPWAVALFVGSALLWLLYRRPWRRGGTGAQHEGEDTAAVPGVALRVAAVVLAVLVATGAVVETYRIGDSGAKAVWEGV